MASDAVKIARLQCRTQLASQTLAIATDPLWSTILGFVVVHKLRKENLVGPVADDILYAGIIAINSARTPGVQELAGKGLNVLGLGAAGVLGLAAGKGLAGKELAGKGLAGKGLGAAAAGGAVLPVAGVVALAAGTTYAGLKLTNPKNPTWKRMIGTAIGGPITGLYRSVQAVKKKG
jgi:drug/metabolite transporter (DMT)-like permease